MTKSGTKIAKARMRSAALSSLAIRDRFRGIAAITHCSHRTAFKISDIVALARALKPFAKKAADINRSNHGGTAPGRRSRLAIKITSRDLIADCCGHSATSLKKAEAVVAAAERSPARFAQIVIHMDRTDNIDFAFNWLCKLMKHKHR